jgi:hypothetical protein
MTRSIENSFGDETDTAVEAAAARAPRRTRNEEKRVETWAPASTLPEPDKLPGYAYRWIRVSTLNEKDPRNISAKLREGWTPVRIEEQPQFQLMVDPDSRFKDNIEVAGLLLCKAPKELMDQRKGYFAGKNQSQMESVDNNFMRESDARMPLFREKKSTTSFGKGR